MYISQTISAYFIFLFFFLAYFKKSDSSSISNIKILKSKYQRL